jgi:hypothetical protein
VTFTNTRAGDTSSFGYTSPPGRWQLLQGPQHSDPEQLRKVGQHRPQSTPAVNPRSQLERVQDFALGLKEAEDSSVKGALLLAGAFLAGNYVWNSYKRNHK